MNEARIFKFLDDEGNSAFVASITPEMAKSRLEDFTLKPLYLDGTKFLDELPGFRSRLDFTGTQIIQNSIPPF